MYKHERDSLSIVSTMLIFITVTYLVYIDTTVCTDSQCINKSSDYLVCHSASLWLPSFHECIYTFGNYFKSYTLTVAYFEAPHTLIMYNILRNTSFIINVILEKAVQQNVQSKEKICFPDFCIPVIITNYSSCVDINRSTLSQHRDHSLNQKE